MALGSDVEFDRRETTLLFSPEAVRTGGGDPYRVFTPFWRSCLRQASIPASKSAPRALKAPRSWPRSESIESLALRPKIGWDGGLAEAWNPGESGAKSRLAAFRKSAIESYGDGRDRPAIVGTSMLSPHLHFGEISPRRIWNAIGGVDGAGEDTVKFLAEIGWRDRAAVRRAARGIGRRRVRRMRSDMAAVVPGDRYRGGFRLCGQRNRRQGQDERQKSHDPIFGDAG